MRSDLATLAGLVCLGLIGLAIILTHTDSGAIVGVVGSISAIVGVSYGNRLSK